MRVSEKWLRELVNIDDTIACLSMVVNGSPICKPNSLFAIHRVNANPPMPINNFCTFFQNVGVFAFALDIISLDTIFFLDILKIFFIYFAITAISIPPMF